MRTQQESEVSLAQMGEGTHYRTPPAASRGTRWPPPVSQRRRETGEVVKRKPRDALFFYGGQRGAAPVIFGEPGDATLLGAVSLEALGFVLDAIRRDLVPLPMVIAGTPRH